MTFRISLSRPMTGSNLLSRAYCTRSVPYLVSASKVLSGSSLVTGPLLTLLSSLENSAFVMLWSEKMRLMAGVAAAKMPIIRCSTEIYSSPMLCAAFSAARRARSVSGEA